MLRALGGARWQLKRSLIDFDVLSQGDCVAYVPPDADAPPPRSDEGEKDGEEEGVRAEGRLVTSVTCALFGVYCDALCGGCLVSMYFVLLSDHRIKANCLMRFGAVFSMSWSMCCQRVSSYGCCLVVDVRTEGGAMDVDDAEPPRNFFANLVQDSGNCHDDCYICNSISLCNIY